jgi:hypothetical protein
MLDKIAKHRAKIQASTIRDRIEQTDCQLSNSQILWESFKNNVKKIAKQTAKEYYHKITSCIKSLENNIKETNNNPAARTSNDLRTHRAFLTSQLKQLKKKKGNYQANLTKAKIANHGERMGSIWSNLSKEIQPHNLIYRLKIPNSNPPQYK